MRTKIPILLLSIVVLMQSVAGQPAGTTNPSVVTFVSIDGGFKIDLPTQTSNYSPVRPVDGESTGGGIFEWSLPDGRRYQIGFEDLVSSSKTEESVLDRVVDKLVAEVAAAGETVSERTAFKFKDHPAVDIRYSVKSGTAHTRYILANNRMFMLTTAWPLGKLSEAYVKAFESFDLIDREAAIAKRLEEATPAALPQTPRIKSIPSDAKMERLRGKVKIVSLSTRYAEPTTETSATKTSESYFDDHGYLLKVISFDYRGNPRDVIAYGFIDSKRVSMTGKRLSYEYDPPPPPPMRVPSPPTGDSKVGGPPSRPAEPPKKADTRFGIEYEFKFDASDRLIEKLSRNNRLDIFWREVFRPDGNRIEKTQFSRDGKLVGRSLTEYDERGNETKYTVFSTSASYPDDSVYQYRYLKIDQKGNWIEREVSGERVRYNGGKQSFRYMEYRQITYY